MRKAKRNRSDFFIDYADADAGWAEWVAWQLQDAGYTVVYRARDFRAGMNVVERKDEELTRLYELLHEGPGIRKYVINGLGGVGKTQVALAYAHEYKYRYQAALFLLRRTRQIQLDATLEHLSEQHRTEALKLSRLLGDLPLMLDQAGACIEAGVLDTGGGLYRGHRPRRGELSGMV